MITLIIGSIIVIALVIAVLSIISIPFLIILGLLPWLLTLAGIVLLVKAAMQKPIRWENFMPAVVAFALAGLLRWIF